RSRGGSSPVLQLIDSPGESGLERGLTSIGATPMVRSLMTRPRLLIVPLSLLACMSLGASCSGGAQGETPSSGGGSSRPAEGPRVESLEQVDTSQLARAEQRVWVELINDLLSPCGEPVSVGRCVAEERGCRR